MREKLLKRIIGIVRVKVYGDRIERFLNLCKSREIEIWNITYIENGCSFSMYAKSFYKLKEINRKAHNKVVIIERCGLPFFLFRYRKRSMFVLGFISFFAIIYVMSLLLWDIEIEGNYSYSDKELVRRINEFGVNFLDKMEEIKCDDIEKYIRNKYSDVTWVSCEKNGCKLKVYINENFFNREKEEKTILEDGFDYSIVAPFDMMVESIVTRSGTPKVVAGSEVKKGDVLIGGYFDVVGDYDEYIRTEYVVADGDVYGIVNMDYKNEISRKYVEKKYTGEFKEYMGICINDKLITINRKCKYEKYDVYSEKKQVAVTKNFSLPVFGIKDFYREYEEVEKQYTDEELEKRLEEKITIYIEEMSKKGYELIDKSIQISTGEEKGIAYGKITLKIKCDEASKTERKMIE